MLDTQDSCFDKAQDERPFHPLWCRPQAAWTILRSAATKNLLWVSTLPSRSRCFTKSILSFAEGFSMTSKEQVA